MDARYRRILVAVDGSENAREAFKTAISIAKRNESDLYIVHVIEMPRITGSRDLRSNLTTSFKMKGQKLIDKYMQGAKEAGVEKALPILEVGTAKQIIAKQLPKANKIDLIIIGATGVNAVSRYFMGSVSENVIRYALCDVLVIHMKEETRK